MKKQKKKDKLKLQIVQTKLKEIIGRQDEIKNICQLTCNEFLKFKCKYKKIVLDLILKSKNDYLSKIILNKT